MQGRRITVKSAMSELKHSYENYCLGFIVSSLHHSILNIVCVWVDCCDCNQGPGQNDRAIGLNGPYPNWCINILKKSRKPLCKS